jgi:cation:H+ antiporter
MPDWILSLAVLISGLIGLMLGTGIVQGALTLSMPWLALVAMLPALAVTLQAVWSDANALGFGVILGVHVLGILLAIGASAHFAGTGVRRARSRAWSLIGASVGVWVLAFDGGIGRADGAVLVLLCLLYLAWLTWTARQATEYAGSCETHEPAVGFGRSARCGVRLLGGFARVCVGLTLLTMSARVLAMGVLDMALVLDLDRWMVGLTLVALASVLAGWMPILIATPRSIGASRIEPGTWFDFNLINLLGLVGLTALTTPGGLPFTRETLLVSWPLVILTSILAGASLMRAEPA